MCALITHKVSRIQAEQQGEGQGITFVIRHVVIRCRYRKWRPGFQLAKLYVSKALALVNVLCARIVYSYLVLFHFVIYR